MPQGPSTDRTDPETTKAHLRVGRFRVRLPRSRAARIGLGVALLAGGMLFFLPVLGFWMVPLGLVILSGEFAAIRRLRRRLALWWGRRNRSGEHI